MLWYDHKWLTVSSIAYYRSLKNHVTGTIEREKKAYFNHYLNNNLNRPKELWGHMKKTVMQDNTSRREIPKHLADPNKINDYFLKLPDNTMNTFTK